MSFRNRTRRLDGMPVRHRLLAAVVAVLWGLNFLAIDASLQAFPPFFLVAVRFALIAVPTILLVPRPQVRLRHLIGYGLGFGTVQFAFLYLGMAAGMPPGLASLVLQSSGPFTVLLGALLFRERVTGRQAAGLLTACAGLALVGWGQSVGLLPFLLVLGGGLGWAFGNLATARAHAPNPLHLTLWMAVVPPLPMAALSLVVEGPDRIGASLAGLSDAAARPALLGLAYTVLLATVVGSGIWSWLMTRHGSALVAPFSMLVPVVGLSAAWLLAGETLTWPEAAGAALVVAGVLHAGRRRTPAPADAAAVTPPRQASGAPTRAPSSTRR